MQNPSKTPDECGSGNQYLGSTSYLIRDVVKDSIPQAEALDRDELYLAGSLETLSRMIETLKDEQRKAFETRDKTQDVLMQRLKDCQTELQLSQNTVHDLERQNSALQGREAILRDIVVKRANACADSISDHTIRHMFEDLSSQVNSIVRKFYGMAPELSFPERCTTVHLEMYRLKERQMPDPQLKNRLRSIIFRVLHDNIFHTMCYGIHAIDPTGSVEDGLSSFERKLRREKRFDEELVAEWRTITMKCAKMLSNGAAYNHLGPDLYDFLLPFVSMNLDREPHSKSQRTKDLQEHVGKLCEDAVKFRILLRSLKDEYVCQMPGAILSFDEAEPSDSERADHGMEEGSNIAYTIFGMLLKRPLYEPREIVVLRKESLAIDW